MPMRPNLLASRRTPSSIAKHSGHLNRSKSYGSLRWELFDQRHSPDTYAQSAPRLRRAFFPNTSSSYIPIVTSQSKRNFSHSARKEGIWDDDDEAPEPKPVQQIPGRPAFVRPTRHRDLGSLVRSRVDGKNRVAQRLRIEKEFNSLPSYQELVESFIQLKYKHVDDLLDESLKANLAYESEYSALSSIFQKRINDVVSRITRQVLHAEKTTQECVTELEGLSSFISAHIVTVVSDNTKKVLQAEKITQKYIAEVIHLSSSILGLGRIQAAVTKAEDTSRMIEHDFCCVVFSRTPEWERKLEISAQKIHGWKKSLRTAQKILLPALVDISELSIRRLRDTLDNDYLRPRNTARSRIDRVLHESEVIQKNYNELKLKRFNSRIFPVRDLCLELQKSSNLHPNDKWVFGQYKEILERSERELSICAHNHRAFWLRRQEALHPLRRSELWSLKDVMDAASSARSRKATDKQVLLALALGARKGSPESRYLDNNSLVISKKIYLEYKRLWMPKPARSPELHIYWRQLDVIAPLLMTGVLTWGLQNEVWYLHHSLKGDLGTLWTWVPEETMAHAVPKIADWCIEFQKHRSGLRQMISEYKHLNWLRLQSETLLHSMGQRVYLAGKFEVLNPMSQDVRGFKKWTARMGQLTSDAYIPLMAVRQTRTDWEFIHDKINRKTGRASSFIPHILELGSSTNRTWCKKGREESESPKAKAAFIKSSQSRLSRYMKGKLSGHSEFSPASQGNQEPGQAMIPTKGSLGKIRQILKRKAGLQHAAELVTNQGSQEDSHLGHKLSPNPSTLKADHTTVGTLVSEPLPVDAPAGQDNHQGSQLVYKASLGHWERKSSLEAPEPNPFLVNAPAGQDNHQGSQLVYKASLGHWERKSSLEVPEPNPFLVNAPSRQIHKEPRRLIYKPSLKLQRTKYRSLDAPEPNPFLVNAPTSQTSQERSQVLPNPPPILPKSKEMSISSEPHFDDLHRQIPRKTSNASPNTRTRNGLRPATMLPRKPFPKPGPNGGRKYSTDATSHQTQFRQSGGVSDDSLSERSIETDISSVPDTTTEHQAGSIEEDDSTDEPIPSSTPQFWSHSSQHSPGGRKLIVHYCRTLQSTEEAVQHFFGSKVIGFDMEWKAQASGWDSIQSNVSVIQIANEERIAIFQVALFKPARSLEDLVSPSLKRLIESPEVMKVGVSIKADCTRLRKYLGIDAKATFELSHLYKLIKYGKDNPKLVNKRGVNLSEQINEHFGLPLEKSDDVRCSDWTRALSYRQVQYAATDPYACVRLFHAMDAKRQAMNPMPPRPAFAELNQPIVLPLGQAVNSEEDPVV
ncbi:hypothetical protein PENPOL_c001G08634 [Penicillium polonicum]|uniref:3'-5' exonuclease domain-containing protein n=1 Tax=Penicillium polonicum TaxID=60169 RepID=A0A1V6P430_PENPO|nr:hypothetical protein PENPOL_c001G08634 [Penicillium polonicum]